MPGYSGAGADFKKPFTVDQIPGLKQAADATAGRVYSMSYDDGTQGQFIYKDDQLVPFNGKDIVYKDEQYYDQDSGSYGTHKVAYSTGQSVIDQAMADPNKWVASNVNWAGLGQGGDFSALDDQLKFLKDNKYDLSTLPNQGGLNQYNVTKQILGQGTTGKWTGAGYGGPVENAKVMASMLTNIGVNDIKDFGKFNGVVSRFDQQVRPKDPADPSKGYVYDEIVNDAFTGRTLDLPKDTPVRTLPYSTEDGGTTMQAIASMPVYGETFGNKATKQSFVDTQNYNRAHGDIFSGTYIGHGHTGYGVQFAADGTPYFYTRFGGDTSSMADIAPVLSFLAVIPTPLQPFAAAANALISLDNGNTLGALASLAGIPGVSEAAGAAGLASVASAVKTANQVVNLVNAIETGNVMALATSAAGMLGANTGSIQIGDTGLTVSDAMKAVNLVKAFESGNPLGMFNAAVSFGTAPNIQKALNSPTTTLDADGQRVADFVGPTFVADLVDPNSENFLGGAEESLGTVLAEAPDNIGSFDSVFGGLKDFGSKYFGGPSQDFFTSQAPAGDGDLVGPTYTPENIGSVGNLMSGPSTDVAGGSNLVDLAAIERERGQVTLGDIQGKQIDLTNVAPGSTLPEVVVGGPSKEDVDNLLKAEDEEVQADLEKAITDAENEVDPAEVERQEAARFEAARVEKKSEAIKSQEEILGAAKGKLSEARKEESDQLDLANLAKKAGDPVGQAEAEGKVDKAKVVIAEQKEIIDTTGKVIQDLKKEEVKDLLGGTGTGTGPGQKGGTTQSADKKSDPYADGRALAPSDPVGEAPPDQKGVMKAPPDQVGVMKEPPSARLGIAPPSAAVTAPTLVAPDAGGTTGPGQKGGTTTASGTEMKDPPAFVEIPVSLPSPGPAGVAPPEQKNVMKEAPPAPKGVIAPEQYGVMLAPPDQKEVMQAPPNPPMGLAAPGGGETMCAVGEFRNPITGLCEAIATPGISTEPVIAPDAGTAPLGVTAPVQKDLTIDPPKEAVTAPTLTAPEGGETMCPIGEMRNPETGECEAPVEPEECKVGEVRNLTTGLCEPAATAGTGTIGNTGTTNNTSNTGTRRTATTIPFLFPSSERPIVTAPSINDDPVMRGALPDMPQETKFQGPLDQFLKLAMESPTPKPQQPQQQQAGNMNDRLTYPQGGSDYFTYGQQSDIDNNLYSQFGQAPTDQPMDGALQFAQGGLAVPLMAAGGTRYGQYAGGGLNVVEHSGKHRVDFRKGDAVTGPGDGQSDDIPAMLADGEYVIDAEIVAALGNGSTKAGSKLLDEFRKHIREHKRGGSLDTIPKKSKSPLEYLDMARRSTRKK